MYSDSKQESDDDNISLYSESFNMALSVFSKIVLKYGNEFFATENMQKLEGLIADLFPYRNEISPILIKVLLCDFTEVILDVADGNGVQKIMDK